MTLGEWLVIVLICAVIGSQIGRWKNHWLRGFLGGLLFGPLGLLVMLLIPASDEARVRRAQARMQAEAEARRRLEGQPNVSTDRG